MFRKIGHRYVSFDAANEGGPGGETPFARCFARHVERGIEGLPDGK